MPLLIGSDLSGLDPKIVQALDDIIAPLQTWAAQVDGVNAQERINALVAGISGLSTVPAGGGMLWFTNTPPSGYIFADGAAISRTTYATLFALWGVSHGIGDGSTTFNTPNLTQRFPLGKAASGTGAVLGATGGAIDHTHTGPSHTHTTPAHTHHISLGGSHGHPWNGGTTTSSGSHDHGGATGTPSGGVAIAHTTTPISADVNGDGSTATVSGHLSGNVIDDGVQTHPISSDGSHTHGPGSLDIGQSSHTHDTDTDGSGTTGSGGTGATGTANPPFFVVNFAVKF